MHLNEKPRQREEGGHAVIKITKIPKKVRIISMLPLAALLVIVGMVLVINTKKSKDTSQTLPLPTILPPQTATEFEEKAIKPIDQLIASQDTNGAIKLIEQEFPKTQDPYQQYTLATRLGNLYFNKGDWRQAVFWFEAAQQTKQLGYENLHEKIGAASEKLGDKTKAIAAYKQVIEILRNQRGSSSKQLLEQYEAKVKELGGS